MSSNMKKIIIILTVIVIAGVAAYVLLGKKIPGKSGGAESSLQELKVEAPELDMSLSPLPKLNISSFNLSFPQLPSSNLFPGISVNTDFSYGGNLDISTPSVQLNLPTAPVSSPSQPTGQQPSQQTPSQQEPSQETSQQGAVNATNCAAFSAIPSSQYCSMAGSSGQDLCEQCKAAGY